MKKAVYLSFSGYSESDGISKKKLAQIRGLNANGWNVVNCYYGIDAHGHSIWMVDDNLLVDLGIGKFAKIKKRTDYSVLEKYIYTNEISFVYMRSEHNATPFLIRFVKNLKQHNVHVVMEIPTYPYDMEYATFKMKCHLMPDKLFRKALAKQMNAIVTFSNETEIFGKRTIQISNGIDFSTIKLKKELHTPNELHLIGVAEIHYWHAFDRLVAGLGKYYEQNKTPETKIIFHLVGEFSGALERDAILPLIEKYNLSEYVVLHGKLFGDALDILFNKADVGIGSLGRHRSGITHIKTLKNREYAARGIPFIYSETDDDFEQKAYIMKVSADESPVDIESVIDFYNSLSIESAEIRNSVQHLSWKEQMGKVLENAKTNNI